MTACMSHMIVRVAPRPLSGSAKNLRIICASDLNAPCWQQENATCEVLLPFDPTPLFYADDAGVKAAAVDLIRDAAGCLRRSGSALGSALERSCDRAEELGLRNRWEVARASRGCDCAAVLVADYGPDALALKLAVFGNGGACVAQYPVADLCPGALSEEIASGLGVRWASDAKVEVWGRSGIGLSVEVPRIRTGAFPR